jgi:glutamyl/glutaminyl-tRNA synthetase
MVVRLILLSLFALSLVGCEPKDRETFSKESGKAWEHASKAAITAWNSVAKKVSEITPDSTKEAMDSARKAAEDAQNKLGAIPNPTPEVMKQIEAAKAALAKLDAATRLKDLQEQAGMMVEDAKLKAENAGKSAEEIQKNLTNANETYQKLMKDVATARENYDNTTQKVNQALGRE